MAIRRLLKLTALLLTAAAAALAHAKELKVMVPASPDEPTRAYLSALSAAPEIAEAKLAFTHLQYGAFGSPMESAKQLQSGVVSLALLPASFLPGFPNDKSLTYVSLLSQPSILGDATEQFYVQDSVLGDLLAQELGQKGLVFLSFWNTSATALVVKRKIRTLADLKGLKVRAPDQRSRELLATLGATPVNLAFGEVYAALERGVVDASATRVERERPGLLEVSRGGTLLSDFQQSLGFLLAGESTWIELTQKERVALQAAAAAATKRARSIVLATESSLPQTAAKHGLTYAKFSGPDGIARPDVATNVWLRTAGSDGAQAVRLLTDVKRQRSPLPKKSGEASPRSKTATKILFATNRNDEGTADLSTRFGIRRDADAQLTCGDVAYDDRPARPFGAPYGGPIALGRGGAKKGITECIDLVAEALQSANGSLVFFIHGYNNSFDDAIRRAISLAKDLVIDDPILAWAWPSQDTPSGYNYDGASVEFSRRYLKDFSAGLFKSGTVKEVLVVAHSMGGRVGLHLLEYSMEARRTLGTIAFVAPDVPQSLFKQAISLYGRGARLTTLYANKNDRPLRLSLTANREAPAGLAGPSLLVMDGVETIDVSKTDDEWIEGNHAHGFDVVPVATDVSALLRQRVGAALRNLPSAKLGNRTYWYILPSP